MHRFLQLGAIIVCSLGLMLSSSTARAEDGTIYLPIVAPEPTTVDAAARPEVGLGVPWRDHRAPWDFKFGNRMDQHQQSKENGNNQLNGFLYIDFTGAMTKKDVPIAVHTDCSVTEECTVGWVMHGLRTEAQLISAGQGQPQWCIPSGAWPTDAPGYTHFHWIRVDKGLGEATEGESFPGYLLKLTAVERFAFGHSHAGSGGSGGSGGGCDDGAHDDGIHDDGIHDDGSHDDGGCDDGTHDDDSGCSGGDGNDGQPKHIPVAPGIDLVTHVNVTVCD